MSERTHGFGVPDTVDPHHFVVTVPAGRSGDIVVSEHFGVTASSDEPDVLVRSRLSREAWRGISEQCKRVLNDRLKEKKLKPSRWSAGDNPVERLLGKELCVLAWAVEVAEPDTYPAAAASWAGLKPEERWWLFRMADQGTGTAEDTDIGWRKAIRVAFTESPGPAEIRAKKKKKTKYIEGDLFSLPLFDEKGR